MLRRVERDTAALAAEPVPNRLGFLTTSLGEPPSTVLCDPLTHLVAYPSFQDYLTRQMGILVGTSLHLAIGDVDDLKRYVTECRSLDPTMFGHLAGNECMRQVGAVTVAWAEEELSAYPFGICGTFGGDEVIVAAAGRGCRPFIESIRQLAAHLRDRAPRSCSFAVASTEPIPSSLMDPRAAYRTLVARVDAALFDRKAALRARNTDPCGEVVEVGIVDVCCTGSGRKVLWKGR